MSSLNLMQLVQGQKAFGGRVIFDGAQVSVNEGEHIGVVGPNGAGKTTLFNILAGSQELDAGELIRSKNLRLGYLVQEDNWSSDETVEAYLEKNCIIPIWNLKRVGKGLGLSEDHFQSVKSALSGGYRMRAKLVYLIGQDPNLMLLDEPTNYLDLESLIVLENFLQGYRGAFLLISHDREFLRRTTDHTVEVEAGEITKFNGHVDDYFEQKSQIRAIQESQAKNQAKKRKEIQDFVDRFRAKATKAKQAQSRLKALNKMESIEVKSMVVTSQIKIPEPVSTGKVSLTAEGVSLGYGDKTVLSDINFQLERGQHLGIVGVNGAGKSTLLKGFAGILEPQVGELKLGYGVDIGYFSQHVAEALDPKDTVFEAIQAKAHPDVKTQEIKDLLGCLLFSGSDIDKKVKVLSGGEKSRVALGQILLKRSPCLLLDEPTNHLDFATVEALTQALMTYKGSLVVVSHDRLFIKRVATRILEIDNGKAEFYPGTYEEYVWRVQKFMMGQGNVGESEEAGSESPTTTNSNSQGGAAISAGENSSAVASEKPKSRGNYKEARKKLEKTIKELKKEASKIEKEMEVKKKEVDILNAELLVCSGADATTLAKGLSDRQEDIEKFEMRYLEVLEETEKFEAELSELIGA